MSNIREIAEIISASHMRGAEPVPHSMYGVCDADSTSILPNSNYIYVGTLHASVAYGSQPLILLDLFDGSHLAVPPTELLGAIVSFTNLRFELSGGPDAFWHFTGYRMNCVDPDKRFTYTPRPSELG